MDDPFDILGLPPTFDLDAETIRAAWLARCAHAHPDARPPGGGAHPDAETLRASAALNNARRTLEDPERRADALLLRLGGPSREQEKGLPPALLAAFMEAREALDEAKAAGESGAIESSREWAEGRRHAHIEEVRRKFQAMGNAPTPEALRAVRIELNAWRYATRMLEQIDEVTM